MNEDDLVLLLFLLGCGLIPFLPLLCHTLSNLLGKKEKAKPKRTQEEKDKLFVDNALTIMAKVMAADRTNMVCELDIIKQFIKKYDEANFKEQINFVKDLAFKTKSATNIDRSEIDKLIKEINEVSNFTRKKWFLEYLFEIAFADGHCDSEEKLFLKRIADKLDGLDMSTYNFMEKKYQKEAKNFTGTRKTEEYSQYETQDDNSSENKYSSYSENGYTYSGKYSYQSSSKESDKKDSDESQEKPRRPLTELEKAYAALGLTETSTDREIKARRRNLMRINHPDLFANKDEAALENANHKCQEINRAFELIKEARGMK